MPQVKLSQVGFRALKDEAFFEALIDNRDDPQQILEPLGWTLSTADLDKLKRSLREPAPVVLDLPKFLKAVHQRGFADGVDWFDFLTDWFDVGRPKL